MGSDNGTGGLSDGEKLDILLDGQMDAEEMLTHIKHQVDGVPNRKTLREQIDEIQASLETLIIWVKRQRPRT
jgi:hypothetical protein